MGFRMPHLHCHIYPQYEHDDPFGSLDPQSGDHQLDANSWQQLRDDVGKQFRKVASR